MLQQSAQISVMHGLGGRGDGKAVHECGIALDAFQQTPQGAFFDSLDEFFQILQEFLPTSVTNGQEVSRIDRSHGDCRDFLDLQL